MLIRIRPGAGSCRGPRPTPQTDTVVDLQTCDGFLDAPTDEAGGFLDHERAVSHGLELAEEGADHIDIGGESTRPGARPPGVEEELHRVIPVVEQPAGLTDVPLSIDTSPSGGDARGGRGGRGDDQRRPGAPRPTVEEQLVGSISAALLAVQRGAHLLRVDDVAATRDALADLAAIEEPGEG